ncbi:MAG: type IX secretion system membrane protein PorP/SprF [Bacteroidetes bacterium]|nr:type IX secretion system membrane protein PorP/SprF [Bacteroidota bacterium]
MMKTNGMLIWVLLLFILVAGNKTIIGQDPIFTQFYSNPIYLNPAFAGSRVCPRFALNYRNEWPNISGNFITTAAAYDQKVESLSGGLGLIVLTDNAAKTVKTTRVSAVYAYNQSITRKFSINFGIEATFFQKSLDWNKLTFGDMIDPRRGFVYPTNDLSRGGTSSGVDFSAGVIGYTDKFFFGFATHHLNEPNESLMNSVDVPLPMRYTAHLGAVMPLEMNGGRYAKNKDFISPNIIFTQQGTFQQLNMGLYIKKSSLTGGIWYRNKDAFIITLGLESEYIKVGYSYDITISKLSLGSGGSHEVSMGFNFACKPKKKSFRTISCPSF